MSETSVKRNSGPNINNESPGVGAHCPGVGQMKRTILRAFDGVGPEVVRVEDPNTGYAETIVSPNGLSLTQAEYDAYKAMT